MDFILNGRYIQKGSFLNIWCHFIYDKTEEHFTKESFFCDGLRFVFSQEDDVIKFMSLFDELFMKNAQSASSDLDRKRKLLIPAKAKIKIAQAKSSKSLGCVPYYETKSERKSRYKRYLSNKTTKMFSMKKNTNGLMASHKGHFFDKDKGVYEKEVQLIGFRNGFSVILENETGGDFKQKFTEGIWNGKEFEISSRESGTDSNILRGLKHCAKK